MQIEHKDVARPKEFEPEQVVERAMEVFWRKGYRATSVQDLVDHTGVNRASLYATFGDKHGLFLRALTHYCEAVVPSRAGILEADDASRPQVREYLETVARDLLGVARNRGCLMVNSTVELAAHDPDVAVHAGRHLERLEKAFGNAIGRAVERGEMAPDTDVVALSRFLVAASQGLMVVGKARPDEASLRDAVESTLEALE